MQALGAKVHAITRSGTTREPVDWIGSMADLDRLLSTAAIVVIALPLTPATSGLLGPRELALMQRDAILVNLARGEIVDEAALWAHLHARPTFTACIDAWWIEPIRHGHFRMDHAFVDLPNVIASPHNSASVTGARLIGLRRAAGNARRALTGETPIHLVGTADRMM